MSKKKTSISESVYEYLMEMILSLQIKPGERISEERIAGEFGSSRAPIRDALKRLQNEGIINIYPNRFAEVATYTDEQIKQIGITRIFLDIMGIKLALLHGSQLDFANMLNLAKAAYDAALAGDKGMRIKKDCDFHMQLSKISKNEMLCKFANELYLRIKFIQASRYTKLPDPEYQLNQHKHIVDLMKQRKEEEAIIALTSHNMNFHGLANDYPIEFFITTQVSGV